MEHPLVSIIIPVYNVEAYLPRCVESMLGQTYENIEVILVDDGSSDGSPALCDAFGEKDSRIRVVHQENQGVSAARNAGLAVARGEWIAFADSDDFVLSGYIEKMVASQQTHGSDWVLSGTIEQRGKKTIMFDRPYHREYVAPEQMEEFLNHWYLLPGYIGGPCAHLYSAALIREHGLSFATGISYAEDTLFNVHYIRHCRSVSVVAEATYVYVRRWGSLSDCTKLSVVEAHERVDRAFADVCHERGYHQAALPFFIRVLGSKLSYGARCDWKTWKQVCRELWEDERTAGIAQGDFTLSGRERLAIRLLCRRQVVALRLLYLGKSAVQSCADGISRKLRKA